MAGALVARRELVRDDRGVFHVRILFGRGVRTLICEHERRHVELVAEIPETVCEEQLCDGCFPGRPSDVCR